MFDPYLLSALVKHIILQACVCLLSLTLNAQSLTRFSHFGVQNGLSNERIEAIAEDDLGFIWLGTQDGLNRFDGQEFRSYFNDSTANSITDNVIDWLHWGTDGKLWIGTQGGLCNLDPKTNKIERFDNEIEDGIYRDRVRCVKEDRQGRLWVAYDHLHPSAGGLAMLNRETGEFENFLLDINLGVNVFIQDPLDDHVIWFGGFKTFGKFNTETLEVTLIESPNAKNSVYPHQWIAHLSDHKLLVTTQQDGILLFDTTDESWREVSSKDRCNCLLHDVGDNWWFTSVSGPLGTFNARTGETKLEPIAWESDTGLPRQRAKALHKDKRGTLWITHDQGLSAIVPELQKFHVKHLDPSEGIVGAPFAASISAPSVGQIVAFTAPARGVYFLNSETGMLEGTMTKYTHAPFKNKNIVGSDVYPFSDSLLIFASRSGLFSLNPRTRQTATILDTLGLGLPWSWDSDFDIYDSTICVGGFFSTLHLFDMKTGEFSITHLPSLSDDVRSEQSGPPSFDNQGRIWHSKDDSPGYFDPRQDSAVSLKDLIDVNVTREVPHSISVRTIGDTLVYYSTQRKGVLELNLASGIKTQILGPENTDKYWASDMLVDQNNHLWSLTNKGLLRWDPVKRTARWFDTDNGLPNSNIQASKIDIGLDGIITVCYVNTLIWFDPNDFLVHEEQPRALFTDFHFAGIQSLSTMAPYLEVVSLLPGLGSFDFKFTATQSSIPTNLQYAFILEGYDEQWQLVNANRSGRYNHVPSGDYVLRVKVKNEDGQWSPFEAALKIEVQQAWYQKWTFKLIGTILFFALLLLIFRWRVSSVRAKERIKADFQKKIAEVEMTALRAQMNPHFLFNCLNSVKYFIVKNKVNEAADYLTKFSRLIRLILNNSKSERVPLEAELEALKLYIEMESLRFGGRFSYTINIAESVDVEMIEIPPLMLQPFVENAVWHGLMHKDGPGELRITIDYQNGMLVCVIADNGIGRQKAQEYKSKSSTKNKSLGMKITTNRIDAINSVYHTSAKIDMTDLFDANEKACGTQITITIPL